MKPWVLAIKNHKYNLFTFLFFCLLGIDGEAVLQSSIDEKWDKTLWSFMERNGEKGQFKGEKGKSIQYFKLIGKANNQSKGALVFSSGQGEPYIKYYELFYDFFKMGYSPIYTYDHRGQGYSERLIKDPKKGYIDSFSYFVKDFNTFMKKIVLKDKNEKTFLLTHSTGGMVTLLYLIEDQKRHSHFKKAAFGSPLIKLKTAPIPYGIGKWAVDLVCRSQALCSLYNPGWSTFNAYIDFKGNRLTNSIERWNYAQRTARKVGDVWFNGPTIKWAYEVFNSRKHFINYKGALKTPLLILQASDDSLVDPLAQEDFCQKKASKCSLLQMKNSKHEIFNEKDEVRSKALKLVDDFFQRTP